AQGHLGKAQDDVNGRGKYYVEVIAPRKVDGICRNDSETRRDHRHTCYDTVPSESIPPPRLVLALPAIVVRAGCVVMRGVFARHPPPVRCAIVHPPLARLRLADLVQRLLMPSVPICEELTAGIDV